jgi:4-hydroxy-2-oxoheptanedioate aldolase
VAVTRYSYQTIGRDRGLPEGLRGQGGQVEPSTIWGISPEEYVRRADPWPLNPGGELMLGLKIEDRHCLPDADAIAGTPGIAFAEWGPGDMGMSFGYADAHDPPYPPEMDDARLTVKKACDRAGVAFYSGWRDPKMTEEEQVRYLIEEIGAKIIPGASPETARARRVLDGRTMHV